jgi:S-layer homology domain/GEVED domain/Bacterial Ig domain
MFNKLKRMVASLGILAITASFLSFPVYAQDTTGPFPDVSGDHMYVEAIQFMKDSGIFEGYPDGTYQPDKVLNRAEQLKVYMLLHGLDPDADTYKNCFPDVKDEWFARFVCFAKVQGWVEGYPDGTYKPAQEVNKVEALKMLGEIQGWTMTTPFEDPFDDTPATEWYAKYVQFAKESNIVIEELGLFNPGDGLTRATTADLLFRSLAIYALNQSAYFYGLDDQIIAIDVTKLVAPAGIILPGATPTAAPTAEYGDAPEDGPAGYAGSFSVVEAAFPTLYNTTNSTYGPGAHALDSSEEWLGDGVAGGLYSYEEDADDSADPDGIENLDNTDDYDDGVTGLNIILTSIPPPAYLTTQITVAPDAPDVPRYVNAVIDLNMDGKWAGNAAGGEPEWVVKNFVVNVSPGSVQTVTSDAFAYSNGLLLTPTTWMRVVLSREPINAATYGTDGWDGSGAFTKGEVEDYYVQLPNWDDGAGGLGGGIGGAGAGGRGLIWGKPAPVMKCPTKVKFPKGQDWVLFSCGIWNFGGRGDVVYDLWRISGLVDVWPVTGLINMATAPPGFFVAGAPGGGMGVMGNPHREWFVGSNRAGTPSTWKYKVVGVDPDSTVGEGVVNLGLIPGEVEEGYEADDSWTVDDFVFWSAEVDDAYLIDPDKLGPSIIDVAFFEEDNTDTPDMHHIIGLADIRDNDNEMGDLDIVWRSPVNCGNMETNLNRLDWTFTAAQYDECLYNGLELTVDDGSNAITESFFDVFVDVGLAEAPPENSAPVINGIGKTWLNAMEDDPHLYNLTLNATDADGDSLTYEWKSVTCGSLTSGIDQQTVQWEYPLADMETCGMAEVQVQVNDGTETVSQTVSIF